MDRAGQLEKVQCRAWAIDHRQGKIICTSKEWWMTGRHRWHASSHRCCEPTALLDDVSVGAKLARDGDLKDAIAGKRCSYR
jgi:hypothetical protein